METSNRAKVKVLCHKISFLMEHQRILPDLKELVTSVYATSAEDVEDCNSEEYMRGATDALHYLLEFLEQKGR